MLLSRLPALPRAPQPQAQSRRPARPTADAQQVRLPLLRESAEACPPGAQSRRHQGQGRQRRRGRGRQADPVSPLQALRGQVRRARLRGAVHRPGARETTGTERAPVTGDLWPAAFGGLRGGFEADAPTGLQAPLVQSPLPRR